MDELVVYQPTKAVSYGHAPRRRGLRRGWELAQDFLREHTSATLVKVGVSTFEASPWTGLATVEAALRRAQDLFGAPVRENQWDLAPEQLEQALAFAFEHDLRQKIGPAFVSFHYDFTWRDMPNPGPSAPFAWRGNALGILMEGSRVQLQPDFQFAAAASDRAFVARLRELEPAYPFKPRDAYYYRLVPKKSGPGERMIKLGEGWKDRV